MSRTSVLLSCCIKPPKNRPCPINSRSSLPRRSGAMVESPTWSLTRGKGTDSSRRPTGVIWSRKSSDFWTSTWSAFSGLSVLALRSVRKVSGRFEASVQPVGPPGNQERGAVAGLLESNLESIHRRILLHEMQRCLDNHGGRIRLGSRRKQQGPILLFVRPSEESVCPRGYFLAGEVQRDRGF